MKREISDRDVLKNFCEKFCAVLEKHCRYVVISGYVAIASGRSRGTEDIDILIEKMDREKFTEINSELYAEGFVCMQTDSADEMYDNYLKDKINIRYIFDSEPLPEIELGIVKDTLDELTLSLRKKIPFTKHDVWFSDINLNIAFKEEYLGTEKDLEDAKHLRTVFGDSIDDNEIARLKNIIRKERMDD